MATSNNAKIEISLAAPSEFHSRYFFPGCNVEGKAAFAGIQMNTLYTALARHVGCVEISAPQIKTSDKCILTETIHSDPVTLQFMCVTHEQEKALPVQVKERINIHKVEQKDSNSDCHVIEPFKITISPKAPNSFRCKGAILRNFIEIKCFSSEYGFHKTLFPITVQKAFLATVDTKLQGASEQSISKTCDLVARNFMCLRRGKAKYTFSLPNSAFLEESLFVRCDIAPTESCEVLIELESKAKAWVEKKEEEEKAEEVLVSKTRHYLGTALKGEKSQLQSEINLESSHPASGMQNSEGSRCGVTCWTLVHLLVTPAKSDGGQDHEQVLTTMQVEIRPQRIRLNHGSRMPAYEQDQSCDKYDTNDNNNSHNPEPFSPSSSKYFDIPDPDDERSSKLRQNGSVTLTPSNSPQHEAITQEAATTMAETNGRSKQLRDVFLGFLKMRYAAGDKTVINYKNKEHDDANSLSSDHTSNTQRHLLKRRVTKKKSSHQGSTSTRTTNDADENGGEILDDGLLESGQMSLRSEDPAVTAALERTSQTPLVDKQQLAFYQSLPGSVVDIPTVVDVARSIKKKDPNKVTLPEGTVVK